MAKEMEYTGRATGGSVSAVDLLGGRQENECDIESQPDDVTLLLTDGKKCLTEGCHEAWRGWAQPPTFHYLLRMARNFLQFSLR